MSRKIISIIGIVAVMLMTAAGDVLAQGLDSLKKVELSVKLEEYFQALKYENIDVQKAECDFLIETSDDPEIRNFIAQTIYYHYKESELMGAEAVAVYLADNWFIPRKVQFEDESEMFAARMYAEFNRLSQIGCPAPEMSMESLDGRFVSLFGGDDDSNRFRVLYFYDADCAKCRIETILLSNTLRTEDFPIDFYAVYLGDDRYQWQEYVRERLSPEPLAASITHLWDPTMESDYQRKYGILQAPRLFLVAPDGTIVGRGLDTHALVQMLHGIFDPVELEYGGKDSEAFFDGIFGTDEVPSADEVAGIADYIASAALEKGDTVMFRQLTGDLLYYLAGHNGEGFKEGLGYMIDRYILDDSRIWRTHDDSLKITGFARVMDDLLSKAEPGTPINDLTVPGELLTWKKRKPVEMSLRNMKGDRNIIIFHTEGCGVCEAEKAAAEAILGAASSKDRRIAKAARRTGVLSINMDEIMTDNPELAELLFESFDLTTLPFILQTDRKGVIERRYLSLQ